MIAAILTSIVIFKAQVTCYTYTEHLSACVFEDDKGEYYVHVCKDGTCHEVGRPAKPEPRPVPAKKVKRKRR